MQSLKGKTSRKMLTEFKELSKKFWGRHIWAAGYFAASSGNVTDEVIMQYLESQDVEQRDDDAKHSYEFSHHRVTFSPASGGDSKPPTFSRG